MTVRRQCLRHGTRGILALLVALALGLGLLQPVPAIAASAPAAPKGLTVVSISTSSVAVSWKAASGSVKYRVQYATSSSMKGAKSRVVAKPYVELNSLGAGRTYYVKVQAISAKARSGYSATLKVKTRPKSSGLTRLPPTGLSAPSPGMDSLTVSWASRGAGVQYRVSWSTSPNSSNAKGVNTRSTTLTLKGLKPKTKYYLRVRVLSLAGKALSTYSKSISVKTTAAATPTKLTVVDTANTSVRLSWNPVPKAARYRVQYSLSASMTKPKQIVTSSATAKITGLSKAKTYYFRVQVVSTKKAPLSSYSARVKTTTTNRTSATYLIPTALRANVNGPAKATVAWDSVGSGLIYQVRYSTKADLAGAPSTRVKANSLTLTALKASTTYYFQVRVVTSTGAARSSFSPTSAFTTPPPASTTLRVASYNVKCANCFSGAANEGTWYERRDAVVATVLAQRPDVIGFQEASQGWLKDVGGTGKQINLSQFEDLVNRMGSPYQLANPHRNNCQKSTTPTNCVKADQGASQGTKIVYNGNTLNLLDEGSKLLTAADAASNTRYLAWAIFEHKASGKRFFFADTHLENGSSAGLADLRVRQTKELLAEIKKRNPANLPTYVVGDFNSSKWTVPSNGPYDEMIAAGYVDPLGNTYNSRSTVSGATVEQRIRTNFSSFNGFKLKAPSFDYINGTYLDYIWTTKGIGVPQWETVVDVDSTGHFQGIIPSDHNMLRATTTLP